MNAWVIPTLKPANPSIAGFAGPAGQERMRGTGRADRERGEYASDPRLGR